MVQVLHVYQTRPEAADSVCCTWIPASVGLLAESSGAICYEHSVLSPGQGSVKKAQFGLVHSHEIDMPQSDFLLYLVTSCPQRLRQLR